MKLVNCNNIYEDFWTQLKYQVYVRVGQQIRNQIAMPIHLNPQLDTRIYVQIDNQMYVRVYEVVSHAIWNHMDKATYEN